MATSLPAERVIRVLETLLFEQTAPQSIRMEMVRSWSLSDWRAWQKTTTLLLYIQPGKPARMRTFNVSNPTCREEVIDAYLFDGLEEIFLITEGWLEEYHTIRPHEAPMLQLC